VSSRIPVKIYNHILVLGVLTPCQLTVDCLPELLILERKVQGQGRHSLALLCDPVQCTQQAYMVNDQEMNQGAGMDS
jgi:hypothetical protein